MHFIGLVCISSDLFCGDDKLSYVCCKKIALVN